MVKENQLGRNIRSLREMYGDTQEELGKYLSVGKNTISHYENGNREPDLETLRQIAKRYETTVDALLHTNLAGLEKMDMSPETLDEVINMFFEIMPLYEHYEGDSEDKDFATGVKYCRQIIEKLSNRDTIRGSIITDAQESFAKSLEIKETPEAIANILWIIFFLWTQMGDTSEWIKLNNRMLVNGVGLKEIMEVQRNESDAVKEKKNGFIKDFDEMIIESLKFLKADPEWSDLADYYLSLRYLWKMVDTDLSENMNESVGLQMMLSFMQLGNKYAEKYLLKCDSI